MNRKRMRAKKLVNYGEWSKAMGALLSNGTADITSNFLAELQKNIPRGITPLSIQAHIQAGHNSPKTHNLYREKNPNPDNDDTNNCKGSETGHPSNPSLTGPAEEKPEQRDQALCTTLNPDKNLQTPKTQTQGWTSIRNGHPYPWSKRRNKLPFARRQNRRHPPSSEGRQEAYLGRTTANNSLAPQKGIAVLPQL